MKTPLLSAVKRTWAVSIALSVFACARDAAPALTRAEPATQARVGECRDLWYEAREDADAERAAFVRGASGLAYFGNGIAVIQDDTQFLGLVAPDGAVHSLTLPPGPQKRRRFEDALGNKHLKLDFEAVTSFTYEDAWLLVAFGSGSSPARESILIVERATPDATPSVRLVAAPDLYAMLRGAHAFCGGQLNVEGAATSRDELVLLQRGIPAPGAAPLNASLHLDLPAFVAWLRGRAPLPKPAEIRRYELPHQGSLGYGFSGLTSIGGDRFVFTASSEDTPSAMHDGPILGSKIGLLTRERAWSADLVDANGRVLAIKAEGVLSVRGRPDRFLIVLDSDDVHAPARLCDVHWPGLQTLGDNT
jgi:hypothetical protein